LIDIKREREREKELWRRRDLFRGEVRELVLREKTYTGSAT